jgi:exodeoxyribonuclease VII large subunit
MSSAKYELKQEQESIERIRKNIPTLFKQTISKNSIELGQMMHSIKLMDPLNVLKRGYSITTINSKTISESNSVKVGDEIITKTSTFRLISTIKKKEND